jgi:hypothetical protein
VRCDSDDEESGVQEGRGEWEKQLARILTATRSSWGTLRRHRIGEATATAATKRRWQWRRWLGIREAEARGRRFIGQPQEPWCAGPGDVRWCGCAMSRPDSGLSPSLAQGRDSPNSWGPSISKRRGGGKGSRPRGRTGPGRRKLGCVEEEGKEKLGR